MADQDNNMIDDVELDMLDDGEVGDDTAPESAEPDYEAEASKRGWTPREQYKGRQPWVDAKEFMLRQPIFDKIHERDSKIEILQANVEALKEMLESQYESGYNTAKAELEQAKQEALRENDLEAYVEVQEKLASLEVDHQKAKTKAAPKQVAEQAPVQEAPKEFTDWLDDNLWYTESPVLAKEADRVSKEIQADFEGNLVGLLDEVTKRVSMKYPKSRYFTKSNRPVAPAVEGSSRMSNKPNKTYTLDDLRPEERKIVENMIKTMPKGKDGKPLADTETYIKTYLEKKASYKR